MGVREPLFSLFLWSQYYSDTWAQRHDKKENQGQQAGLMGKGACC